MVYRFVYNLLEEELKKELVTNEFLINVKEELEFKIDKVSLLVKVLIGINVIALTFLNPTFVELIKSLINF